MGMPKIYNNITFSIISPIDERTRDKKVSDEIGGVNTSG